MRNDHIAMGQGIRQIHKEGFAVPGLKKVNSLLMDEISGVNRIFIKIGVKVDPFVIVP